MPIEYRTNEARFVDVVGVEDAEALLAFVQADPPPRVDLAACVHLHAAPLQILMAAKSIISVWPRDVALATWLASALVETPGSEVRP